MPIQVGWGDEEQTIILWFYSQEWTWQESVEAAEQTQILRRSAGQESVVVILNMEVTQTIPRDSIRNMRRLLHSLEAQDFVILCGNNAAVDVVTAFLRTLFHDQANRILMAPTLSEAHDLARKLLSARE